MWFVVAASVETRSTARRRSGLVSVARLRIWNMQSHTIKRQVNKARCNGVPAKLLFLCLSVCLLPRSYCRTKPWPWAKYKGQCSFRIPRASPTSQTQR